MADEPKPPAPSSVPPPPPPAPVEGAAPVGTSGPPAGGGKPPTKLILMGCGGVAALVVAILIIWGLAGLFGGGLSTPSSDPELKTAEDSAKSLWLFQEQQEFIEDGWRYDRVGDRIDDQEELYPWLADKAEAEKQVKLMKKRADAFNKYKSDLEVKKANISVIEAPGDDSAKKVKLKLTGKELKQEGEDYKLVDRTEERVLEMTRIEGKWKCKNPR